MRRRNFFKWSGAAAFGGLSPLQSLMPLPEKEPQTLIKPKPLRPGATVALIAPCSPCPEPRITKAVESLAAMGYNVREGQSLRNQYGYLAGTDRQRLDDLHGAFADPEVEAVWCVRGGYGGGRLLPDIDYELIRKNPKIFIGYSDVTALHLAIYRKTGLVTFHGQVAAGDFPEDTLLWMKRTVERGEKDIVLAAPDPEADDLPGDAYVPFTVRPGKSQGVLTGGNLSLLAPLVGTPFAPSYKDKIVFIEDVGEQPYRIDRLFTQLLQATDIAAAAGIALGVFTDCNPKGEAPSLTLVETLNDRLRGLGIPVVYGLPFGHIARQAVLPYGIRAELDAGAMTLTLAEAAVAE